MSAALTTNVALQSPDLLPSQVPGSLVLILNFADPEGKPLRFVQLRVKFSSSSQAICRVCILNEAGRKINMVEDCYTFFKYDNTKIKKTMISLSAMMSCAIHPVAS